MSKDFEVVHGGPRGLSYEAIWFTAHTLVAIFILMAMADIGLYLNISQEPSSPKLVGTLLAFVIPLIIAFIIAKLQQNPVAQYVWISGLIILGVVSVWVIDLPTSSGLCEHCGTTEKLWRTFFAIDHGSGLLDGDGLLVGAWIPLSLFGYSLGAKAALDASPSTDAGSDPLKLW